MRRSWAWILIVLAMVALLVIASRLSSDSAEGSTTPVSTATTAPASTARPISTARQTAVATPIPGVAAVVRNVIDGDTIVARVGGKDETVRIIGMDSPETHKPDTPVECFGTEATAAAKRLMPKGAHVTLQSDPTQATRDRFGRLLAHVFLADGTLFAERMIRDGFAVHYVYDRVPSIYADRLAAAQQAAKAASAGLWSPRTCAGNPHMPSAAPH